MSDTTNELNRLKAELESLKHEHQLLNEQLKLKTRHLDIILQHSTVALAAFNKEGIIELNIGNGLPTKSKKISVEAYLNLLFTLNSNELNTMIPHIVHAVRIAFDKKVVTRAETEAATGHLFHAVFVPYINENKIVEYVYCIAIRWPNKDEINPELFFKGTVNLPPILPSED